ncbi:MAG: fimbrillin family protein, partial [Bacteroidales bacterium]
MKKWMIIPFITTIVIVGCTENSNSGDGDPDPNAIAIDAFVPKMQKGVDATTSTLASGISIYAYKTGEAYSTSPFMKGVVFTKPGAGNWTSSPVTYWPMYPLDFFGFYPKTVAPTDVTVPTKFSFTVAPDAANQFDVVTSFTGNQDRELVQMKYHHALSKINFKI